MKFPSKCPHCGKDIADISAITHFFPKEVTNTIIRKTPGVASSKYTCMHCKNNIYILRGYITTKSGPMVVNDSILSCYPLPKNFTYPDRMIKLSPEAYEIYTQAFQAHETGLNKLVGAGIRMALERLVFQYLIQIQGYSQHDLEGKMLGKLIPLLDGTINQNLYLRVLKYFGNKSIHVANSQNFTIEEAFQAFNLLLEELDRILLNREFEIKMNSFEN